MKDNLYKYYNLVEKPMRYIGEELNSIKKDWDKIGLKTLFAFPDTYEVGMSHLGLKIIYHLVNEQKDMLMERVFSPWTDMEALLRENDEPLVSLETKTHIKEFDVIGFTLQYEMSYTNILNILDLGKIPLKSEDRGDDSPIVVAGGPCVYNPEPLADFVDIFIIGDGEESTISLFEKINDHKKKNGMMKKAELFEELLELDGIYIPKFYGVDEAGLVEALHPKAKLPITKNFVTDLDEAYFPTKPILPYIETVHDRAMVEVLRGCNRGCRFCHAGMVYRPVRERSKEVIEAQAREIIKNTGYDEIALTSLSTSDHTQIQEIIQDINEENEGEGIGISLPSLRVDNFSVGIAKEVSKVRKTTLTFAPEAGTQRMRDVINKGVNEEDLLEVAASAFKEGWGHIKLYFMMGLPTETMEDIKGIADLAFKVLKVGDANNPNPKRQVRVTISVAAFVPKAHTPFQWVAQDSLELIKEKQRYLKTQIRSKRISYKYHDGDLGTIEGVFARGDRKVGEVLLRAFEKGCKFDGWGQYFDYEKWLEAFDEFGIDISEYNGRERATDERFPWDHINCGVRKEFLLKEYQKSLKAELTGDCRFSLCSVCGICQDLPLKVNLKGGKTVEIKNEI